MLLRLFDLTKILRRRVTKSVVPSPLLMVCLAFPLAIANAAFVSAATITVTPSIIGPGETATIRVEYSGDVDKPEILTTLGILGPLQVRGNGVYEATLFYDGPGSAMVVFRPKPWQQIEAIAVAHFRGTPSESIPSVVLSRENHTVAEVGGTWMTVVDDSISISGLDPTATLNTVQVKIAGGFHSGQDQLGLLIDGTFVQTLSQNGITVSHTDGTLTFEGEAPLAQYIELLRKVAYRNTAPYPNMVQRKIDFIVADVEPITEDVDHLDNIAYDPVTGHYYEYVHDPSTWINANRKAAVRTLFGLQGYLATITSEAENNLIGSIAVDDAWIGASSHFDRCHGGNPCGLYRWLTGPEAGEVISQWKQPYSGNPNAYMNWADWNQNTESDRRYVYMNGQTAPAQERFKWVNPRNDTTVTVPGYIVEYGGFPGDTGPVIPRGSVVIAFPSPPETGPVDPDKSWLSVSPAFIQANGIDSATVTVTLKDEAGNPFISFPPSITVRNATVGPVNHIGGGVYTATVTSTQPGTSQIIVDVDGQEVLREGLITFRKSAIDDDEPLLLLSRSEATLNRSDPWMVIDPVIEIQGLKPHSQLQGAKVEIKYGFNAAEDELGFVINGQWQSGYSANGITGTYDASTGTLAFSGDASWSAYKTALSLVAYRNHNTTHQGDFPSRQVDFSIVKEMPGRLIGYDPVTDHYYEYVEVPQITWTEAEKAAANRSLYGRQGYLATITSQEENDYISSFTPKSSWIGGSDIEQFETWRWMTGPETGQVFWHGLFDGTGVPGVFANWGSDEPNHYPTNWGTEHYVQIFGQDAQKLEGVLESDIGKWNDLPDYHDTWVDGYIVEYGGMLGDPVKISFSDSILLHVTSSPPADAIWSTVTVDRDWILANGQDQAQITVTLKDANGEPVQREYDVQIRGRHGNFSTVTFVGDGVYTATVTSIVPGSTRVVVTFDGVEISDFPMIVFRNDLSDEPPALVLSQDENDAYQAGAPIIVDELLEIQGLSPTALIVGARVKVTSGLVADDDILGFVNEGVWSTDYSENGIATGYDANTGTLTLTGTATVAVYQELLRTVAYKHVNGDPEANLAQRTVEFRVIMTPPAGRTIAFEGSSKTYFEFVNERWSWERAELQAANRSLFGMQGYLATIHSAAENQAASALITEFAWLGGSDSEAEGEWRWMTGPETGVQFWLGVIGGHGMGGVYANWGDDEPNNYEETNERYLHIYPPSEPDRGGKWNDESLNADQVHAFVVKYGGGLPGDPVPMLCDSTEGTGFELCATMKINILPNEAPTADFTWTHETPRFGETVAFEDRSLNPGAGELTYAWSFGDGGSSTEPHPTHTYEAPGTYTVSLTVTNLGQLSHTLSQTIHITADLRGYVFNDVNRSGTRDGNESGLGMTDLFVTLVQNGQIVATAPDAVHGHTFDRGSGEYHFNRLPVGSYDVVVGYQSSPVPVVPPGWSLTTSGSGMPLEAISLALLATSSSGTKRGPDFGFAQGFVVSGTVFRDDGGQAGTPNDGAKNGGEVGLGGLRVRAIDSNGAPLGTALTDANGNYHLVAFDGGGSSPETARIRLVLTGTNLRSTGYTPGLGATPVRLENFSQNVDVVLGMATGPHEYSGYDFGVVPAMTVIGTGDGSVVRGGLAIYPFSVELGTKGVLSISISSPRGWYYAIYHDREDAGDVPFQMNGESVGPGKVPLLMVVRAPSWELDGAVDTARIDVNFAFDGNPSLSEASHFYSLTTIQSGRLDLVAEVRNVTQNVPPGEYNFTQAQVDAREGDVLEYRMTYKNTGVTKVTDVVVSAPIPQGTRLVQDAYGSEQFIDWIQGGGAVTSYSSWTISLHLAEVLPNQAGTFTYQVMLD